MFSSDNPLRIPVYGSEINTKGRGVGLWSTGYRGTMLAAGAEPVFLKPATGGESWDEILDRKSTRLNSSHIQKSRMPSSA